MGIAPYGGDETDFGAASSWSLLVVISFVLIVDLKHLNAPRNNGAAGDRATVAH